MEHRGFVRSVVGGIGRLRRLTRVLDAKERRKNALV